jgi:hypothetical protein
MDTNDDQYIKSMKEHVDKIATENIFIYGNIMNNYEFIVSKTLKELYDPNDDIYIALLKNQWVLDIISKYKYQKIYCHPTINQTNKLRKSNKSK